ncbi:MAG: NADH-quinone oxidoreductase subunit NuoK [Chloroflexi bacterium]|nr:MAG: NADH-quinone oxidoreductase subunit NuoK [Chloroflexota bacterium]TMD99581.1 MAG: NADH-quinone oxidoreductase subunit NuoK [Chloroflexota bacterium]
MIDIQVFPLLLGLSAAMFTIGSVGVLVRRNPLVVLMSIELMLNAVNLAFVDYGRFLNSEDGQVFALVVIVVAAAEAVVGLALVSQVYRAGRELDIDDLSEMRE